MPPPCSRCTSQRVIHLETARKLGTAAGALAGSLKGAYASLNSPSRLLATSALFPLSRVATAVMAATSGGIAGAAAGHQMVQHLFPPGEGTPWLCWGCGHAFRVLN
ncbi:hypothetical protein HOP52_12280 [Halomonas campisalis]|uniref:Uncharacterized protein n=1 Tax=Billgrantia campisalis TaxID=74661 RepID=A0ABS9PBM3_9GAMM|nr:hypothetical protein [Halomonas campisalis]MCG6658530.1 hypothetical protein [Halomonas campisalis]MDR5863391.1 hypothetical protein [Halomonas campisalis]